MSCEFSAAQSSVCDVLLPFVCRRLADCAMRFGYLIQHRRTDQTRRRDPILQIPTIYNPLTPEFLFSATMSFHGRLSPIPSS